MIPGSFPQRGMQLKVESRFEAKCSEPIEYETWTTKMLANELDKATHTLMQTEQVAPQAGQAKRQRNEPRGLDSSWGDCGTRADKVEQEVNVRKRFDAYKEQLHVGAFHAYPSPFSTSI
ncbi:hypothetical protein Tco_1074132 [Tanacetum coccineum]